MQGLKLETYVKGSENCIMSIVYTADDLFYFYNNITDFQLRSWEAPLMNVSKIIAGNVANGVFDCTVMWLSLYEFSVERYAFFESKIGTFVMAFMFNLMGKAVLIKNI
jgi:hypothetical protein